MTEETTPTEETPAKPKPVSMDTVNDGILHGKLTSTKTECQVCGMGTRCVELVDADLPEGIEEGSTILKQAGGMITFLGVGCGDYAKFHRQVAHIQGKRELRAQLQRKIDKKKDKGKKKKHGRQNKA